MKKEVTVCDQCGDEQKTDDWWKLAVKLPDGCLPSYYITFKETRAITEIGLERETEIRDLCSESCLQRMEGQLREVMK